MMKRVQTVGMALALLLPVTALAADDMHEAGRLLYLRYCSACHGADAKGDGVVSGLMEPRPLDLTQLAKRDNGTFPFQSVAKTIDGRQTVRAHGDPDMPVWGEVLTKEERTNIGGQSVVRTKVASITGYLESIQQK